MISIALDVMGGDHAPTEILKGALLAIKEYPIHIILVGDKIVIQQDEPNYNIIMVEKDKETIIASTAANLLEE